MNIRSSVATVSACTLVLAAGLGSYPSDAQAAGYGGAHAGGFRAAGGYGYRGGYGFRGGYGYRGYGYHGGWGWGWGGLGYGLFFGALPLYYSTLWWGGVPYYYAAGDYYLWNSTANMYETVAPPPGLEGQGPGSGPPPAPSNLFVYPKNGQSAEQQATDRYECHRWASTQTGFDPTQPGSVAGEAAHPGAAPSAPGQAQAPGNRQDYMRAQTACLEARGYSVR